MVVSSLTRFDGPPATAPAANTPFRSPDWFELLAQHGMPPDAALSIARGNDDAPWLPLIRHGSTLAGLSNFYTGVYGPVGAEDGTVEDWLALCRHWRKQPDRPALIHLKPLDADGKFFTAMRAALKAAGYWVDHHFCFGNWHCRPTGVDFSTYLSQRPSAVRNTLRRCRAKLEKAGQLGIQIHTAPCDDLECAIDAYEAIYQRSWKPAETYPDFIRQLCRLAARHGWLRLGVLTLDDQPIASQLWLFSAGTAYIFKLAYDPDAARYSPGTVLTAALMEQAIDRDHAVEIDYLSGDDTYKQDWMDQRRERVGLIAFDPTTPLGLWRGARHFAARRIKALLGEGNRS